MIWLIDYSHYSRSIDPRLSRCKSDYFKLKSYIRYNKIGPTAPVSSRVYGTGLLRLATILSYNGIPVRYMHYYMLEELLAAGEPLPERVAFSCVCPTVPLCAALAERIKAVSPSTYILIGGPHVNLNPDLTKERFPIFDEMSTGYEMEAAKKIAGRPLWCLPCRYVDYSLLPLPLREYAINTLTTVGCPFSCDYCSDAYAPHFQATKDGQLSVMKDLLPERTLVHFFDSVLGYSKEGVLRVCDSIKRTGHKFLLSCDMRADIMTPELARAMEEAGFVEVRLGMESADDGILAKSSRTLKNRTFTEQVKMIRESSDLYVSLYSITGLPGTDEISHGRTLEFCDYLFSEGLVDEIKNALYVPYPVQGVDYSKRGITIINEDWSCYDRQSYPVFKTDKMSSDRLWELYMYTAQEINRSWLRANGFASFGDVPVIDGYYREYVEENYLGKYKKGT